jgi:predicted nucleotide-binding protein
MPRADADAKIGARLDDGQKLRDALAREPSVDGPHDLGVIVGERQSDPTHTYGEWDDYNVEMLRRMFTNGPIADEYSIFAGGIVSLTRGAENPHAIVERTARKFDDKLSRLRSIRKRLELIDEPAAPRSSSASTIPAAAYTVRRAAFIVHGHDEGAREATARVLQQLDVEPIILHEKTNQGRTILEKIEAHANDVPFAVILLTPDDVGGKSPDDLKPRARQNVILELGFFWGRLSRSHVCVLYKEGVELPSDLGGLVYVLMDDGGAWRFKLADELHAAGIDINFNRLRRS